MGRERPVLTREHERRRFTRGERVRPQHSPQQKHVVSSLYGARACAASYAKLLNCGKNCTPFTAVTRVQIPSGTPNLINHLDEQYRFFAGTKRNSRTVRFVCPAVPRLHCPKICRLFRRHKKAQTHTPAVGAIARTRSKRITPLCALRFCAVTACV